MADAGAAAPSTPAQGNQTPTDPKPQDNQTPQTEPWKQVKHRYKAEGQDVEVDYDELVRRAQRGHGAEKRIAEVSQKERAIQAQIDGLSKAETLDDVVKLLGGEERARPLMEKFLWSRIEKEDKLKELSPSERSAYEAREASERKAQELQDQLDRIQADAAEKAKSAKSEQASTIINKEIEDAIALAEKEGLLPEDVPYMLDKLFDAMLVHLEYLDDCEQAGLEPTQMPMSASDVMRMMRDKDSQRNGDWLKKLSAKDLQGLLSPEQMEGLRRAHVDTLMTPSTSNRAASGKKTDTTPIDPFASQQKPKKKPNTKDWFAAMENRYRGR